MKSGNISVSLPEALEVLSTDKSTEIKLSHL